MKLRYLIAVPVIAVLVLPAEATQFLGFASPSSLVENRLSAMQDVLGVTVDPNQSLDFSISLPHAFTTLDVSADPFA